MRSAIARELRVEALDGNYRCEGCARRGLTSREWRLARLPPCLLVHVNRTRIDAASPGPQKRQGSVTPPEHLPLQGIHGNAHCELAVAACHAGVEARAGHWTTWRRLVPADGRAAWVVDDDDRRREPRANENLAELLVIALYRRRH